MNETPTDEGIAMINEAARAAYEMAKNLALVYNQDTDDPEPIRIPALAWEEMTLEQRLVWSFNIRQSLVTMTQMLGQFGLWLDGDYEPPKIDIAALIQNMISPGSVDREEEGPGNYL